MNLTPSVRNAYLDTLYGNQVKVQRRITENRRTIRQLNDQIEEDERQLREIDRSIAHLEG